MIGDDHIDSQPVRGLDGVHCGDAAIHGYDEPHPLGGKGRQGILVESVPLLQTVRHMEKGVQSNPSQEMNQDRGACQAVNVVVPVYENLFTGKDGLLDPVNGLFHFGKIF